MKNSILILFLLALTAIGCKHQSLNKKFGIANEDSIVKIQEELQISDSAISILVPEIDPTVINFLKLDDIFDTLNYIKLETSDDNIVGRIDKIEIVNDTIYILDKITQAIFTFKLNGEKVNKIGQIGNGPGEYKEATSMTVTKDYIFVYDQWQLKVIKYNHQGKVISDHRLPFFCQKVVPLNNGDILCFGAGMDNYHLPKILDYCFWQCDSTFSEITHCGLYSEQSKTIVNGSIPLEHYNGCWHYFHIKTNEYYKISPEGSICKVAHVQFTPDYCEDFYTNIDYRFNEMRENHAIAVSEMFETASHFVYELSGCGYPVFVFFNKKEGTSKFLNMTNIMDSNMSRLLHFYSPRYVYGESIVFNIRPETLVNKAQRYQKDTGKDLWDGAPDHVRKFDQELLNSLHEEDNDILVFAKIKEHFD